MIDKEIRTNSAYTKAFTLVSERLRVVGMTTLSDTDIDVLDKYHGSGDLLR